MEDWLMPTLQELESRECMADDLPQLIEKLRVSVSRLLLLTSNKMNFGKDRGQIFGEL